MAKRRGFIFTNKKHSDRAVMGSALGIISLAGLVAMVLLSYQKQGEIHAGYGVAGFLALVFAVIGLILGIRSFQERDTFPIFSWVAVASSGAALLLVGFLVYAGM